MTAEIFDGFGLDRIDVGAATLRVRHGGTGPPVLLAAALSEFLCSGPEAGREQPGLRSGPEPGRD